MPGKITLSTRPVPAPIGLLRGLYLSGLMPTVLFKKFMDRLAPPNGRICGDVELDFPCGTVRIDTDDAIGRDIFLFLSYDRNVIAFLRFLFAETRSATMLDIGANIGNHALWLAGRFRQAHCFEPNPAALDYLRVNAACHENVTLHPLGLSDGPGTAWLELPGEHNLGQARIGDGKPADAQEIPLEAGDDFLRREEIQDIDFIKIDVEGHEWEVLTGLTETIREQTPIIVFEYHRDTAEKSDFGIEKFLAGYALYGLTGLPKSRQLRGLREGIILEPFDARGEYNNVLCVPRDAVQELENRVPGMVWYNKRFFSNGDLKKI